EGDGHDRQPVRATRRGANLLILHLEVGGGSFEVARDLADFIRGLRGPDGLPVVTIAFIPQDAPDTATFLALGCTEIVMGQGAKFGNFANLLRPAAPQLGPGRGRRAPPPPQPPVANPDAIRDSLKALAQDQGYPPLIIQGLL